MKRNSWRHHGWGKNIRSLKESTQTKVEFSLERFPSQAQRPCSCCPASAGVTINSTGEKKIAGVEAVTRRTMTNPWITQAMRPLQEQRFHDVKNSGQERPSTICTGDFLPWVRVGFLCIAGCSDVIICSGQLKRWMWFPKRQLHQGSD